MIQIPKSTLATTLKDDPNIDLFSPSVLAVVGRLTFGGPVNSYSECWTAYLIPEKVERTGFLTDLHFPPVLIYIHILTKSIS
jgi:hypothetical protein